MAHTTRKIPLIEVSGAPYEMGFELGKKARNFIRAGTTFYKKNWHAMTGLSWRTSTHWIERTIPLTKKLLPKTFAEIQGVGQGSGVPWHDLFAINSFEALERFRPRGKCTSILAKHGKRMLLAHNEDWIAKDREWLYVLKARPKGEPTYLTLNYGAWLFGYGLNSAGIAYVADSLTASDARHGLSQTFIGREILRCHTVRQAVRAVTSLPHADGHGYVIAGDTEGTAVEATARAYAKLRFTPPYLVHTNFYQSPSLQKYERGARTYSRFRYFQAQKLLSQQLEQKVKNALLSNSRDRGTLTTMLVSILADHTNYPESICCHIAETKHDLTKDQTIASFILDPSRRTMHLIAGNPCRGKVHTFAL